MIGASGGAAGEGEVALVDFAGEIALFFGGSDFAGG
jgi:hypothetical protein